MARKCRNHSLQTNLRHYESCKFDVDFFFFFLGGEGIVVHDDIQLGKGYFCITL